MHVKYLSVSNWIVTGQPLLSGQTFRAEHDGQLDTGQPLLSGQTFRAEHDCQVGTILALCLVDHQVGSSTISHLSLQVFMLLMKT